VNPLAEDDLTVANPYSLLVPSIRIGSPVTLASATGDVVWYDLDDPPPPDTMAPDVTIRSGNDRIVVDVDPWNDAGAMCTDNRDGSLPVTIGGDTVNVNDTGTYTVTYTCTDAAGNTDTASRTVTVYDPAVNQAPTVAVDPPAVTITAGTAYDVLTGVTCNDDQAATITPTHESSPPFDNTTPDRYTITYTCTDDQEATGNGTRTITVDPLPIAASIAFDVTHGGSWDNGNIELTIDGTATAVPGNIVLTTTIPARRQRLQSPREVVAA